MIEQTQIIEGGLVTGLFIGYIALWLVKRRTDIRTTGHDPEVLAKAKTPVQQYFGRLLKVFTLGAVAMIGLHTFGSTNRALLSRFDLIDIMPVDVIGALVGVLGLTICFVAQKTMGNSWRVGIDNETQSKLITSGIFKWIRNPTYVGLFTLNFGVWLIWPSAFVAMYCLLFFVVMEIQVRCEEEHLLRMHKAEYASYLASTQRYLPWLY